MSILGVLLPYLRVAALLRGRNPRCRFPYPSASLFLGGFLLLFSAQAARAELAWRDATVEFSDGRTFAGKALLTNDQLILYSDQQKRRVIIGGDEVRTFEAVIEREVMERKWFFKEGGNDEKVYTGETWPIKEFTGRVTFHDGRTLEGHLISSTLTLQEGEENRRYFLPRKMEGEVGQKLDDLVFIRKITFQGGASAGALGCISGAAALPSGETLQGMAAIHQEKSASFNATLLPKRRFQFAQLTAGTYDIAAVTDKAVYYSTSREQAPGCARFDAAALKEVADWAAQVNDFFTSHAPLYGAGNTDSAFVLVAMERRGNMTLEGGELDRRYEVWLMEKPAGEWRIKSRFFVYREMLKKADVPARAFSYCPQLAGLKISREAPNVEVSLQLSSQAAKP